MSVGKTLLCDCGYEVRAADDAAFIDAIRRHARDAHGIEFTLELALDLARGAQRDGDELIGKEMQ
jgi:predicted small metal-binding protein